MAVGHSIFVAAWHIFTHDIDYDGLGYRVTPERVA